MQIRYIFPSAVAAVESFALWRPQKEVVERKGSKEREYPYSHVITNASLHTMRLH